MQPTHEILPWKNDELKALLERLIAHGTETAKVDYKAEIEAGTPEQKAELLKDITAIANTYDESYGDHGFLIYGVQGRTITGISRTETNTDKLQNTVEQLLKSYIAAMPQIYVIGFETATGQKWGTIVIPPRNSKPHMFFKDLQCTNPRYIRKKGEWFVRRGSTTDPGMPEDLALIMQRQTQLLLQPLHESVRNLQARVAKTEEQYDSALFKLVERAFSATPEITERSSRENIVADVNQLLLTDLHSKLRQKLRTPKDALAEELASEAKSIQEFLDGPNTSLPWVPQLNDSEANRKIIEDLEARTQNLQLSVATIVLNDKKGEYTEALLRALKILAKAVDAPIGVPYSQIGTALRYYPLGLILYTIVACSVAANRGELIRKVLAISLVHRRRDGTTASIAYIFYHWYEARVFFNHAFAQRWCEPIAQRIRQIIGDRISEMATDITEPELYFPGEFVLALAGIDMSMSRSAEAEHRVPLPGLYLYVSEAEGPIENLLRDHPDWFDKIYDHPMNEILDSFDRNAGKAVAPSCIGLGLHGLNTLALYEESLKRKPTKS